MTKTLSLDLEEECSRCTGSGKTYDSGAMTDCVRCEGDGYIPTELGEDILSFLRKYLKKEDLP